MKAQDLKSFDLPDSPGVYFFIGSSDQVLYIGKATSLKSRVRSYFTIDLEVKRSPLIKKMTTEATRLEWRVLDSVLEALIVETNLIRTHKPLYNTRSKDDKSYFRIIFTKEEWPRILMVRERDVYEEFDEKSILYDFGPYTSGQMLRQALKIIQKIFRFYDTSIPIDKAHSKLEKGKINFNRQIGLYPTEDKRKEYQRTIKHLKWFFEGKKHSIIKELEKEMLMLAKQEKFEQANITKKKIYSLKHIDDVSLIKRDTIDDVFTTAFRIEAYDVSHHSGKEMVGVMTVVDKGEPNRSEYRRFKIKTVKHANDPGALKEVIKRRLGHKEWALPKLIVVDGNEIQKRVVLEALSTYGLDIPVVCVVKNDKHKVDRLIGDLGLIKNYQYDIILANSEAHRFAISYHHRLSRNKMLQR